MADKESKNYQLTCQVFAGSGQNWMTHYTHLHKQVIRTQIYTGHDNGLGLAKPEPASPKNIAHPEKIQFENLDPPHLLYVWTRIRPVVIIWYYNGTWCVCCVHASACLCGWTDGHYMDVSSGRVKWARFRCTQPCFQNPDLPWFKKNTHTRPSPRKPPRSGLLPSFSHIHDTNPIYIVKTCF